MTDLANEDLCTICHRDKEAHKSMRHAFSPFGQSSTLFEKTPEAPPLLSDQPRSTVKLPSASDPILRMVLLRLGLITVADIEAVEQELRATGVAGHDPAKTLG